MSRSSSGVDSLFHKLTALVFREVDGLDDCDAARMRPLGSALKDCEKAMTDIKQRLASLHLARDSFFAALKDHEHAIYKLGYEDGFCAGWEAALTRLAELKPEAKFKSTGPTDLSHLLHQQQAEVPTHDILLDILKGSPGLQRGEIVDIARKKMPTMNERTVRTALQRMKNAGELRVAENRWYLTEKRQSATS